MTGNGSWYDLQTESIDLDGQHIELRKHLPRRVARELRDIPRQFPRDEDGRISLESIALVSDWDIRFVGAYIAAYVRDWTYTDREGRPLAVAPESIDELPDDHVEALFKRIIQIRDGRPAEEERSFRAESDGAAGHAGASEAVAAGEPVPA